MFNFVREGYMKKLYYILLLILAGTQGFAQIRVTEEISDDTTSVIHSWDNNITFNADPRLAVLLEKHKSQQSGGYSGTRYMRGYRVQIYYGTDRNQAINRKVDFMRRFPGIKTYMAYTQPQYRVKVGNFATREDAVETYRMAINAYGACMIVPDNVVIVYNPQSAGND